MIAIKGFERKLTDGSLVWNVCVEDTEAEQSLILHAYDRESAVALVDALRDAISDNSPELVDAQIR